MNCFSLALFETDSPIMLISNINNVGVEGEFWNGRKFEGNATIPFMYMAGLTIRVDHYHGLVTHTYLGIWQFILNEWTLLYRLKSLSLLAKHAVPQFLFNRKKLELPTRMHLLGKLLAKQADAPNSSFTSLDMMTYVYSIRWYQHPNTNNLKQRLELYMESFVASGELQKLGGAHEYKITGTAISSMEK